MTILALRRPYVCREMVELITDYLEGALPRSQRRRFDAHIAGCEHCGEYLRQMRETIRLTGTLTDADLTSAMREEFGELFRQMRDEDARDREA